MMKRYRQLMVVFGCAIGLPVWAQTTQPAKRSLTFEQGEVWDGTGFDLPDYAAFVAVFRVPGDTCLEGMPPRGQLEFLRGRGLDDLAARADQFQFSPELRDPLTAPRPAGKNGYPVRVLSEPAEKDGQVFTCSAAKAEDAQRMAAALLDYIDTRRRAEYDSIRQHLEQAQQEIAQQPDQISKMKKEHIELLQKIDTLAKIVPVTKWGQGGVSDYQVELQKVLRAAHIEVASIQAKMDAIKKLRQATGGPLVQHLDQMQATQDVELAGALIRKSMIETDLKNTTDYSEAMNRQIKLGESIPRLESSLGQRRKELPRLEKMKADADRRHLLEPIQVLGPIQIRPVEKAAEMPRGPATAPTK